MLESVYSRFPNITIPQGATVTDAYVTYTVDDNYTASSNMTGTIKLQDVDDATAPTTNAGFYAAPRTTATAPWVFQTSWSHDDQVDTTDLTDLVQEVIDRPGWASGNSIGVFIDDPQTGTGTADWAFYAYDQTPAKAPQLHIEYTTSGGLSESASTTYIGGVYERTVTDTDTTETSYYTLTSLVASRTDGVLEWIITDHLGSPNTTIHPSTGATTRRLHDPYGTERHDDGITTDRSFTGQLSDPSSGLLFYNARYYDPVSGRFISPDTIVPDRADPQALNRYSYVTNNPASYVDPTGHCGWMPWTGDSACPGGTFVSDGVSDFVGEHWDEAAVGIVCGLAAVGTAGVSGGVCVGVALASVAVNSAVEITAEENADTATLGEAALIIGENSLDAALAALPGWPLEGTLGLAATKGVVTYGPAVYEGIGLTRVEAAVIAGVSETVGFILSINLGGVDSSAGAPELLDPLSAEEAFAESSRDLAYRQLQNARAHKLRPM